MTGRLLLVGRDWGFHEHMARRPFVGPAGALLNRGLKQAGINRESECLVTNVVNKKPQHDEWRMHSSADVSAGMQSLFTLAQREVPALIVAFGEQALHALIVGDPDAALYKITEARGYVFPSKFGPVLAATHPAFILRTWHPWWALFCLDLQKARRVYDEARNGGWEGGAPAGRAHYTEEIITDAAALEPLRRARPARPTAIDIETNADLSIACIGWSWERSLGWCAPFRDAFFPFFHALLDSGVPKIMMNGQFDSTILERHGFPVRNWTEDVMIQWHSLEPLLAGKVTLGEDGDGGGKATHKSLRFLTSLLTDQPFFKDYNFPDEMARFRLCAIDARITWEVHEKLKERLNVRSL